MVFSKAQFFVLFIQIAHKIVRNFAVCETFPVWKDKLSLQRVRKFSRKPQPDSSGKTQIGKID